jgi:hypothetical protein
MIGLEVFGLQPALDGVVDVVHFSLLVRRERYLCRCFKGIFDLPCLEDVGAPLPAGSESKCAGYQPTHRESHNFQFIKNGAKCRCGVRFSP